MPNLANTPTITTDLNVSPYYDDFSEASDNYRILFRPGLAVQARELTQMQSYMQAQIARFGQHIFSEGSRVRGCEINYDQNFYYLKLRDRTSAGANVNIANFQGSIVEGATSGIVARVLWAANGSEANTPYFKTLFLKYITANATGQKYFSNNEIIRTVGGATVYTANTIKSSMGSSTGAGSAVTISPGIVFAKGHFIRVRQQRIILNRYSANVSCRVGIGFTESIVDENSDTTLLDPASGSFNYTAPGAARLRIIGYLQTKTTVESNTDNFTELMQLSRGVIQSTAAVTEYSQIKDYMARRLFEQSGNYIVKGMSVRLRENLFSSNNGGLFTSASGGNTSHLAVQIEPGIAYVSGYDTTKITTTTLTMSKATTTASAVDIPILADYQNYVVVDNVSGKWDLDGQAIVQLRDTQANAISTRNYSLTTFAGTAIGTARVRALEYYQGTPGLPSAQYKAYLTDIKITSAGRSFANVQSISYSAASSANGKMDIVGARGTNANVADPAFNRVVFRIPAKAIRSIRNTSGSVATDFDFYKSFDITFNNAGTASIATGAASETFSGSGTLSTAVGRSNFIVFARASANTLTLTGGVKSVGAASNTITGNGTSFTTQINPGDLISVAGYSNTHLVTQVTSATSLKVLNSVKISAAAAGVAFWKNIRQGQILDASGFGRNGARSVAIPSATSATININETLNSPSTLTATAIVKLNKSNGQEAAKAVARSRYIQVRVGSGGGTSYVANTTGPYPLGLSDGFKLVSVRMKSGSNFGAVTEGTDVTTHFTLDTGMRDNLYDHARLVKKSASILTIASGDRFLVKLDYFTHSYSGGVGYFSIDSYPVNDTTAGSDTTKIYTYQVPIYVSSIDGKRFDLRDSLDLRPRTTDTANSVTSLTNISINPLLSTSLDTPSGGMHFAQVGSSYELDFSYYLKRNDLLTLNKDGTFRLVAGVPSLTPVTPDAPDDSMGLARIQLAPYPSLPAEVARSVSRADQACGVYPIKNERFTMKDVGAIRDRVDRLEYYTSLSLLEKAAKDQQLPSGSGTERFKNGIVVDAFVGHNVGNVFDQDYKISIDPAKGEARPPFRMDNLAVNYNTANSNHIVRTNVTASGVSRDQTVYISNTQVAFSNTETLTSGASTATLKYQVANKLYIEAATGNFAAAATVTGGTSGRSSTIVSVDTTEAGDLATLPYTHIALVTQPYATMSRNCTGIFYNYAGTMILYPDGDYWTDTTVRPDVQINYDSGQDNWLNLTNSWSSQWRSWQTVITGQTEPGSRESGSGASIGGVNEHPDNFGDQSGVNAMARSTSIAGRPQTTPITRVERAGERTRDVNIVPFMRSKEVLFEVQGLKPNTKIYPFFDGFYVGAYVTPMTSAFVATAVSGATLVTRSDGSFYGSLLIPSDSTLKFRTGSKLFRVSDSPTNSLAAGSVTTAAQAMYTAQGLMVTQQQTIVSTRTVVVEQPIVTTIYVNTGGGETGGGGGVGVLPVDRGPVLISPPNGPITPVLPPVGPTITVVILPPSPPAVVAPGGVPVVPPVVPYHLPAYTPYYNDTNSAEGIFVLIPEPASDGEIAFNEAESQDRAGGGGG